MIVTNDRNGRYLVVLPRVIWEKDRMELQLSKIPTYSTCVRTFIFELI